MTTKVQHTGGRWTPSKVEYEDGFWKSIRENEELWSVGSGGDIVAIVFGTSKDHSEDVANARLIAAAPELLAALKRAQEALSFTPGYYTKRGPLADAIRAAIAKAEGR